MRAQSLQNTRNCVARSDSSVIGGYAGHNIDRSKLLEWQPFALQIKVSFQSSGIRFVFLSYCVAFHLIQGHWGYNYDRLTIRRTDNPVKTEGESNKYRILNSLSNAVH